MHRRYSVHPQFFFREPGVSVSFPVLKQKFLRAETFVSLRRNICFSTEKLILQADRIT